MISKHPLGFKFAVPYIDFTNLETAIALIILLLHILNLRVDILRLSILIAFTCSLVFNFK